MMIIIIVIIIAIMIMMIVIILIIAVVIINSPFQPVDFSIGSTTAEVCFRQTNCMEFMNWEISLQNRNFYIWMCSYTV